MNRPLILYHGGCPDGFGGAYAAWKKFGDTAEYHELSRSKPFPVEECAGRDVYFIDFSYNSDEEMARYQSAASSLTVLDHHEGVKEIVKKLPQHVYDANRSGAGIAWDYFHEGAARPKLIDYLEDDDLFRFSHPETKPVLSYLGLHPFTFEFWDETAATLEDSERSAALLQKASIFAECFDKLADLSVEHAKMVEFEGRTVPFANAHPYKPIKSLVGNKLAKKFPPFALVVSAHPEGYGVSIRGDGSVNVAEIASHYGGNGHPSSAGFLISRDGPFPWKLVEEGYDE